MDQQALAATALDGEAHAFIQLPGPAVVCHDRKLEPVYLVLQSPLLEFPQEPGTDPMPASGSQHADHHVRGDLVTAEATAPCVHVADQLSRCLGHDHGGVDGARHRAQITGDILSAFGALAGARGA